MPLNAAGEPLGSCASHRHHRPWPFLAEELPFNVAEICGSCSLPVEAGKGKITRCQWGGELYH